MGHARTDTDHTAPQRRGDGAAPPRSTNRGLGPRRTTATLLADPAHCSRVQTKASMTTDNGRAFNEWLRAQLKAKRMSQRQLAQQSGVDHSTISRLIRGDRMPSLGTATKLARGLREIREDADTATALGVVSVGPQNPTARVEYALRADEALTEPQVRQIMEYYLAVRMRRFARTYSSVGPADQASAATASAARPSGSSASSVYGRPSAYAAPASRRPPSTAPPRRATVRRGPRPAPAHPGRP